jgi:hypothetical protein
LLAIIENFLKVKEFLIFKGHIDTPNYPVTCVLGIAGAVQENKVKTTNVPHWPESDG